MFFNAVFHLTARTVNLVVDLLCVPNQIGDYKAKVGSLGGAEKLSVKLFE